MPDQSTIIQPGAAPDLSPGKIKGRVIVTYGRSLMALVIARALHEHCLDVIGCDDVDMTVLGFSRHVSRTFVHAPLETDTEQALIDIEEAVRRHAPDDGVPYVLMPAFRDARIFARHRKRFEPFIRIAAPELESIEMIDPKDRFARFLEEHGLPGPRTLILPAGRALDDPPPPETTLPLIAKPVDGVGGRGVERIETEAELADYLQRSDPKSPLLLQEPIEGSDYCCAVVAVRGELIAAVVYRNILQFPIKSGAGAVRETVDATPFLPAAKAVIAKTRWNGVCEIDFRWNGSDDTEPKMLEVNPRYWAGLFHSMASGIDFPWMNYCLATGQPVTHPDKDAVEIGLRTRTPGAWLLSAAQDMAASDPHMKRAAEAWTEVRDSVSEGELLTALTRVLESAKESLHGVTAISGLRERLKEHSGLESELNSDKDPAVGLGVLFALSSILRHGELPPELRFGGPKTPVHDTPPRRRMTSRARRPVIGVTKPDTGHWLSFQAMRFAVWCAGGRAVKITTRAPMDPHSIDGLVFGGGADVFPKRYQGRPKKGYRYNLARDDMEASWAEVAFKHDIPMLGICRGMQMLNVLGGGTLHHDLSEFRSGPTSFLHRAFFRVGVRLEPDSWLAETTRRTELRINAIHTQAIDKLGVGFRPVAWEINGLVQAIEHSRSTFLIGLQFHPELLIHRGFARRIFKGLIEEARIHFHELQAATASEQASQKTAATPPDPAGQSPPPVDNR